jgi:hypothetical protein
MPEYIPHYVRYIVYGQDNQYQVAYSYLLGADKARGYAFDAAYLVQGSVTGVYTEHTSEGLRYHEEEVANYHPKTKGNI